MAGSLKKSNDWSILHHCQRNVVVLALGCLFDCLLKSISSELGHTKSRIFFSKENFFCYSFLYLLQRHSFSSSITVIVVNIILSWLIQISYGIRLVILGPL
ncbi:hypothetical protein K450DRAFT_260942 [Umbelopsis ramanniana AG]|uniref:Uncharacterized protein n=1 Tax=Umbelopsis ramanniana AG TaxID=1314678 RepID=A0AAD5E1P6_UMBRA|nr:uncharacterized protein K450DRAFT_260942 [Umbelopsis ramanniana AG]KAI8575618.1 hypothetical protein K450DRAFT_260942 [Umbelopsis ramanniana AG]